MKKFISMLMIVAMLMTAMVTTGFAAGFSDLNQQHWAYSAVSKLVAEGTINGFEDGTYRPNDTVSRAQFVKMIGKGPVTTTDKYVDVTSDKWYYEYVMTSGLKPVSKTRFEPDTPIKRGDVAELLWTRNGAVTGCKVPMVISNQGENPEALSWIYSKGIMMGDNLVDLRLGDPLTRAEAAALIIRARDNVNAQAKDFVTSLDDKTLKAVYEGVNAFDDKAYSPDANITHGELAHMALRLATGGHEILYSRFSFDTPKFEHKYAKQMAVYGKYCIGEDKITPEYIDSPATVQDVVTAVSFGLVRSSLVSLDYGAKDGYYSDALPANENENKLLTMANKHNIMLNSNGTINAKKTATLRDVACVILQADGISGFNKSYVFAKNNKYIAHSVRNNADTYPASAGKYPVILQDIPNDIYSAPFVLYGEGEKIGDANVTISTVKDFGDLFTTMLTDIAGTLSDGGEDIQIEFVPSMVINNGNGYTYRVRIFADNVSEGATLGYLIPLAAGVEDVALENGKSVWVDIETGGKLSGVYFSADKCAINKIVKVDK